MLPQVLFELPVCWVGNSGTLVSRVRVAVFLAHFSVRCHALPRSSSLPSQHAKPRRIQDKCSRRNLPYPPLLQQDKLLSVVTRSEESSRLPASQGGQGYAADNQRAPDELDQPDSLTQRKHRDHGGEHRDEIQEDRPSSRPDALDSYAPGHEGRYRG